MIFSLEFAHGRRDAAFRLAHRQGKIQGRRAWRRLDGVGLLRIKYIRNKPTETAMTQRLDYAKLSPELIKKYSEFSMALKTTSLGPAIKHLVDLRASQMNGCAFCVDMHVKEAKIQGERELRLHHVAVWRESPLFDARERAALEWTEALTKLGPHGVPDEIYNAVRAVLSEKELSELSFMVVAINGWNRMSVGFTVVPGSMDGLYGLAKSGLS
jgi:AhpD family alkylhydroperoxidase